MEGFNKIETGTIVEKIVKEITGAIMDKKLRPGDKLPSETEMSNKFGVSRTSIRESMKILSALGLIEIKRGNGTFIATEIKSNSFDTLMSAVVLEQSPTEEVLELRKMFEIDILNLVIQKATDKDIDCLEEIQGRLEEEFEKKNYHKAAELDYEFHKALVKLTRNKLFEKMVLSVYDFFFKSIERTIISYESREKKAPKIHREMLNVIRTRDSKNVTKIVESSLEGWKNYL